MHMIKHDQSKVRNMDLLWRYYEKSRSFGKAAQVLARLAEMRRFDHTQTHKQPHECNYGQEFPLLVMHDSYIYVFYQALITTSIYYLLARVSTLDSFTCRLCCYKHSTLNTEC